MTYAAPQMTYAAPQPAPVSYAAPPVTMTMAAPPMTYMAPEQPMTYMAPPVQERPREVGATQDGGVVQRITVPGMHMKMHEQATFTIHNSTTVRTSQVAPP